MKFVSLPDNLIRPLPFFLAMEEWLARNSADEFFFMWQVAPTVICGRNQVVDLEVNLDYCTRNGINICRRKSGGGCVFADFNNIMFSYITNSSSITTEFSAYTTMIAEMLHKLGLDSSATTRNDVLIKDRKVSGNAFYHIPELSRAIVHGTMLYDADTEKMSQAITPSRAKLESKGVKSVASRVTTIREHSDISIEDFKTFVKKELCGEKDVTLTPKAIGEIETMAQELMSEKWIYRKTSGKALVRTGRISGSGEFRAEIEIADSTIRSINLTGDYFPLVDIDSALLPRLQNISYSRRAVNDALAGVDVSMMISGLSTEEFTKLIVTP